MKRKHVIFLVVIAIVIGIAASIVWAKEYFESNLEKLVDVNVSDVDLKKVPDGVFTGSYKAFPVEAEVKVTVKGHRITEIVLVKHNHGQGGSAEVIPGKVVETQTLDVDVVSGATYSSKVILKAIENALVGSLKK